ncbi:MAG: SH3 domain-containing protein [Acetatifactor sp.]|nr:SH3 domain-containing protein [Acetatifactor sp.]
MAKEISTKKRRIRRKILGAAIWTLPAAVIILVSVVFFWIFSSPLSDAQGGTTITPHELEIEDTLPDDREVLQDEPVAVLPLETSSPEEESAPEQEEELYTYTELDETLYAQTSLRVRDQPLVEGSQIGGLYRNQEIKATGRCNETGWYRIDFYGTVGYASDEYLAAEPVKLDFTQSVGSFAAVDKSYYDNVLFIGDSLTVGLSMYGNLKNAKYFCITGMGADEALGKDMDGVTLDALLDSYQYEAVYIMLGINDMGLKRKSYLSVYGALLGHVQEKQPNASIVIQSLLPVTSSYTAEHPKFNNDEIRERNAGLAELADGVQIFYLDLNTFFVDDAGNLRASQARDGLHLKSSAYKVWKDALLANGIVR